MHPLDGDGADSVRALIRPAATEYSTRRRDIESKKSRRFFPLILNVAKKKKKMMILSRNFLHTVYTHTEEAEYKSKRQEPWHRRPLRRNPLEWTAHNGP